MTKSTELKDNKNSNNLLSNSFEKNKSAFFKIFYDCDKHLYYLIDLGIGYGTFFKIEEEIAIKENSIINIGESYLIFSFKQKMKKMKKNLMKMIYILKYILMKGSLPQC